MYLHDIDDNEDVYLDAEEILNDYDNSNNHSNEQNYDINTTVFEISKASSNPKARLPPQAWYGLSPGGRCTWDNLTDEDKAALIGNLTNQTQQSQQKRLPPRPSKYPSTSTTTRKANAHESSTSDMERFQAAFHVFCVKHREANKTDIDTSVVADDNPEELHTFMAQ